MIIPTFPPPTKPRKARYGQGVCRDKAPCGYKCCLSAWPHTLHACKDATCELCHGRERWEVQP